MYYSLVGIYLEFYCFNGFVSFIVSKRRFHCMDHRLNRISIRTHHGCTFLCSRIFFSIKITSDNSKVFTKIKQYTLIVCCFIAWKASLLEMMYFGAKLLVLYVILRSNLFNLLLNTFFFFLTPTQPQNVHWFQYNQDVWSQTVVAIWRFTAHSDINIVCGISYNVVFPNMKNVIKESKNLWKNPEEEIRKN